MAIPTSRAKETGIITIDEDKCTGCALCVTVCKDFSIVIENGKAKAGIDPVFGCISCGHCMAVCPEGAIAVNGRTLSPDDLFDLPPGDHAADYNQLLALLQHRRSIREFTDKEVEPEKIEKILEVAVTAPMGLPPSDVNVMILGSKARNRVFVEDFCNYLEGMRWFVSGWFLALMRPLWGKANDELFRGFVKPCFDVFISRMKEGENVVTYDAPLAIYFYGSPYCDPADPIIAATYAMLAGETLGLGTCMIGSIHPLIQSGKKAARLREKYGIKYKSREGVFVIFGYPALKYNKGIARTFASVTPLN
jgi:ferredoxin